MVDKYTWLDIGSSYLPSEIVAAFLWAQLQQAERVTNERKEIWARYHDAFMLAEREEKIRRPIVPAYCTSNGHIYYIPLSSKKVRDVLIERLGSEGILAPFHYIPLHSSPAGIRFGRSHGTLSHTDLLSQRLIRLPLFLGMGDDQELVIESVLKFIRNL